MGRRAHATVWRSEDNCWSLFPPSMWNWGWSDHQAWWQVPPIIAFPITAFQMTAIFLAFFTLPAYRCSSHLFKSAPHTIHTANTSHTANTCSPSYKPGPFLVDTALLMSPSRVDIKIDTFKEAPNGEVEMLKNKHLTLTVSSPSGWGHLWPMKCPLTYTGMLGNNRARDGLQLPSCQSIQSSHLVEARLVQLHRGKEDKMNAPPCK